MSVNLFPLSFGTNGVKVSLDRDLKKRVQEHKSNFVSLFTRRYKEMLPSLIRYRNGNTVSIDFLKVEIALRNNYNVVIGQAKNGKHMIMGYYANSNSSENPADLFSNKPLTKDDITLTIPKNLEPEFMKEISYYDDCTTGNFVILRNKPLTYMNDYEIVVHYTNYLAEIELSRYSIAMQAKLNRIFLSEAGDETINELISDLYNGAPYTKMTHHFDPKEHILDVASEHMAQNFNELKRERENVLSEMHNMLGINSLAVEKESGVSDTEAKSNRAQVVSNANINLDGRNNALEKYNKRFGLEIEAIYNDEVASELQKEMSDKLDEENYNNRGTDSVGMDK